ncbi:hypothetical protein D3C81_1269030 [compost metagenome]
MSYPSSGTVIRRCSFLAVGGKPADEIYQGLVHFGHIAGFCWPIVHLSIDIERIIAAPRSPSLFVPYTLKIGWLGSRSRT